MIRKAYAITSDNESQTHIRESNDKLRQEIISFINKAFQDGAIVQLKIVKGTDVENGNKEFSDLSLNIISSTPYNMF